MPHLEHKPHLPLGALSQLLAIVERGAFQLQRTVDAEFAIRLFKSRFPGSRVHDLQ